MRVASLRHHFVYRRSPRPHTKLVFTLHWFLLTLLPLVWIVGSFPEPVEEGADQKGRICGCFLTGEVWMLVQRHRSDLYRNLVHPGLDVGLTGKYFSTRCISGIGRWISGKTLVVIRVQYTYPYSPTST